MRVVDWKAMERKLTLEARKFLKENYNIDLEIPIKVNGRLKSTYGLFRHKGVINRKSVMIELSKNYIEHQEWKIVRETLIHECIHYALYELGKPHRDGHPVFERELQKHGSHSTGTVEYRGKVVEYGCPTCDAVFRRKKRYPNNGKGYTCKQCREQIIFLGEKII